MQQDTERAAQEAAKKRAEAAKSRKPGETFNDCEFCPVMAVIPAGTFRMGDIQGGGQEDERPVHTVHIGKQFAMGKYEVTFAEYDRFTEATGRKKPDDAGWGRGNRPVMRVNWEDANAYAAWLSAQTGKRYRLPTEAEWEYAARADTETKYWWGDDIQQDGRVWANSSRCGSRWDNRRTAPVGSFSPNGFGPYNTAGNVFEWVEDCWHENYQGAPTGGRAWWQGDCRLGVLRGGSWYFTDGLRSADRIANDSGNQFYYYGFRLARDL